MEVQKQPKPPIDPNLLKRDLTHLASQLIDARVFLRESDSARPSIHGMAGPKMDAIDALAPSLFSDIFRILRQLYWGHVEPKLPKNRTSSVKSQPKLLSGLQESAILMKPFIQLVFVSYAKLMSAKALVTEAPDMLPIVCYFLLKILSDSEYEQHWHSLPDFVIQVTKQCLNKLHSANRAQDIYVEQVVLSAISICFWPFIVEVYDANTMVHFFTIMDEVLRLAISPQSSFHTSLINFERTTFGYVFLYLFVSPTSFEEYKTSGLLNVALIVAEKLYVKLESMVRRDKINKSVDVAKIQERFLTLLDQLVGKQIGSYFASEAYWRSQSNAEGKEPQGHRVVRKTYDNCSASAYLQEKDERLDWLRINATLHRLIQLYAPRFFVKKDGFDSHFCHLYDLLRIQLYLVLRFSHYQLNLSPKTSPKLSDIPSHLQYDCNLVQTLKMLSNIIFYHDRQSNTDLNSEILGQVFATIVMVSRGHYEEFDTRGWLKLYCALFLIEQLSTLPIEGVVIWEKGAGQKIDDLRIVEDLLGMVSAADYQEKYIQIFEDLFDLDSTNDILSLQAIIVKTEFSKRPDAEAQDLAINFVNRAIVQKLIISYISQQVAKSAHLFNHALRHAEKQIQTNCLFSCDATRYVDTTLVHECADTLQTLSFTEYKIHNSGLFNCQLYQWLKLVLGLLSPQILARGRAYSTLVSCDNELQPREDDNLLWTFRMVEFNQALESDRLTELLNFLLVICRNIFHTFQVLNSSTKPLIDLETLRKLEPMTETATKLQVEQIIKQTNDKNKYMTQKERVQNSVPRLKVFEKAGCWMTRFVIYCSQNQICNEVIIKLITPQSGPPSSSWSYTDLDKRSYTFQRSSVSINEMSDLEFRLVMLRNILFLVDPTSTQLIKPMQQTLDKIKDEFAKAKDISTELNKLAVKIYPQLRESLGQKRGSIRNSQRERSCSNLILLECDTIQKQRDTFSRYAKIAVSFIREYVLLMQKSGGHSIKLLERKSILDPILVQIQAFVESEQSQLSKLIEAATLMYCFRSIEDANPLKLDERTQVSFTHFQNSQTLTNKISVMNERHLDFLLTTVVDYMHLVYNENSLEPLLPQEVDPEKLECLIQSMKLMFDQLNTNCASAENERERVTSDLIKLQRSIRPEHISKLKKIYIFLMENISVVKETDAKEVIKSLSIFVVRLLGVLPKAILLRDFFSFFREILYYNQLMDEVDCSLLVEILKVLNSSISFYNRSQLSLLGSQRGPRNEQIDQFIFNEMVPGLILMNNVECAEKLQIFMLFKFNLDTFTQRANHASRHSSMVLMALQERTDADNDPRASFTVELVIDHTECSFTMKDPTQKHREKQNTYVPFKPIPVENRWYALLVRISRKSFTLSRETELSFEAFINQLQPDSQVMSGQLKSNPRARLFMSLANTVDYCMFDPSTCVAEVASYTKDDAKKDYERLFRGRCSLPVFLQGLDNTSVSNLEPQIQSELIPTLIEKVNKKKIMSTKQREESGFFSKTKKTTDNIHTVDTLTSMVAIQHQILQKQGFICALHQCKTSNVFVAIGGFKNMLPIIYKVLKSNLGELGPEKPGKVFSYVFRVFTTLINLEPAHVETLMRSRSLINLLKYSIFKIGTSRMLTSEFLSDVLNIVRNNILVQLEVRQGHQPYSLIKNCSQDVQSHEQFYQEFLRLFTHEVLLNPSILELQCLQQTGPNWTPMPGQGKWLVLNEVAEFIYQVCCPQKLQEEPVRNATGISTQTKLITDYQRLNSVIVSQVTIAQMITLLQQKAFIYFDNLALLDRVGQAISASILRLDDKATLHAIVSTVLQASQGGDIHQITLLVFLRILLRIVRSQLCTQKQIQSVIKNLTEKSFANILVQFKDIYQHSRQDEILKDQITSVTLLVMTQFYVHNRRGYGKKTLHEKVCSYDQEKRKFLSIVADKMSKNKIIHTDTYLTLMQVAFRKQPSSSASDKTEIPSHFDVDVMIKKCLIKRDIKVTEIIDFDIDFYFLVLENFTNYSKATKKIFLQQFGLLTGHLYERFLTVCAGQKTDDQGHNSFNARLKNVFYKLVQYSPCEICAIRPKQENSVALHASMQEAQECEELSVLTDERIVEICVNQFTKSIDDYPSAYHLNETDRWGIVIFKRILICLEQDLRVQLTTLTKVIEKLIKEVNKNTVVVQMSDQVKLIMKVMLLVQFVEQLYAKNSVKYSQSALFQQMMMALMFLCEQLGILTMDLPDRASRDFFEDQEQKQGQTLETMKSNDSNNNSTSNRGKMQQDISFGLDDALTMIKAQDTLSTVSQASMQQHSVLNTADLLAQSSKTENFIAGGPMRAFLHILFNSLVKQSGDSKHFTQTVEMLRYLVLRQRQGFFTEVVTGMFGDNFSTRQETVYNLFNRQSYVEMLKLSSKKGKPQSAILWQPEVQGQSLLHVKSLLDAERQIIKDTLFGILSTLDVVCNEETMIAERMGLDKKEMQSKREKEIAERNEKSFRKHQYGVTSVDFFLISLILTESLQVVSACAREQLEEAPHEQTEAHFGFSGSSQSEGTPTIVSTDSQTLDQIVDKTKLNNLTTLLSFTYECMNEHFKNKKCVRRGDQVDNAICNNVSEDLQNWNNALLDDYENQVAFFSTFLDSPLQEELERKAKYNSNAKKSTSDIQLKGSKLAVSLQNLYLPDLIVSIPGKNSANALKQSNSPRLSKEQRLQQLTLQRNISDSPYLPSSKLKLLSPDPPLLIDSQTLLMSKESSLHQSHEDDGKMLILDFLDSIFTIAGSLSIVQTDWEKATLIDQLIKTFSWNPNNRKVYFGLAKQSSNRLTYELLQVIKSSRDVHQTTIQEASQFVDTHIPSIQIELNSDVAFQLEVIQPQHSASDVQIDSSESILRQQPVSKNTSSAIFESSTSTTSLVPERDTPKNLNMTRTLKFQYARCSFKSIVKRLQEDESSMWYDHIEEQHTEFREIKMIYDSIQTMLADDKRVLNTAKRLDYYNQKLSTLNIEKDSDYRKMERFLNQSFIVENPNQKQYFQCQRRILDNWGRMMLFKPNRKALNYKSWLFYDYFVFFFLNKLFAVSLLSEDKLQDIVKPLINKGLVNSIKELQQNLSVVQKQQAASQDQSDLPESWEQCTTPYSVDVQKFRNEMLQRIDTNHLLKRVLTNQHRVESAAKQTQDLALIKRRKQKMKDLYEYERGHNKALLFVDAQQVRVEGTLYGQILVTKHYFCFLSMCCEVPKEPHLKYIDQKCRFDKKDLILTWEQVDEIMKQKLVNIFQGVNILTHEKKSFTFNFCSEAKADTFIEAAAEFLKDRKEIGSYRIIENPRKALMVKENIDFTTVTEWKNGQRSNMELLMLCNKYSGRNFNDLSQYPIFPWVLKDYESEPLKFQDLFRSNQWQRDYSTAADFVFRDLSKHVGSTISPEKEKQAQRMYEDHLDDPVFESHTLGYGEFHMKFGMNAIQYVCQWLCRMEPFTSSLFILQDQKRDQRLPIEFAFYWRSVMTNKQACWELLPELYYSPEFYMNLNKLSLGTQPIENYLPIAQLSQDSIILPPWAANAYDLVRALRDALESKYVTQNLSHWIDMVFGVHSRSLEKMTIYFPCAYDDFWQSERLNYETLEKRGLDKELCPEHREQILVFYTHPSKIFEKSLTREVDVALQASIDNNEKGNRQAPQQDEIKQLIKSFVESSIQKKKLQTLGQIAVHNNFDPSTNIIHMIFNNEKKCIVFVRQPDPNNNPETGNIVVYLCQETLSKESFKDKFFDIKVRYEWVAQDLNSAFQVNSLYGNKLYVCGFMDNSLRVFDLETKPGNHQVAVLQGQHAARITCIKFSADQKYFYSCDADGLILHYGLKSKEGVRKDPFPYRLLHKLQDQMDEILAIDTNQTLDMYVTFSRDGTLAVRCQRTSKLWYQFKIYSKVEIKKTGQQQKQDVLVIGFSKIFKAIQALKLSLHGYIVLVGQPENAQKGVSKFLVYNLSGDVLLNDGPERYDVKGIFLNANEDQLVIAQNTVVQGQKQGRIRVVKLYSLDKIADLNDIIYKETRSQIRAQKQTQQHLAALNERERNAQNVPMPTISVIAMKKGETSLNIFFEHQREENGRKIGPLEKEILCFEIGKLPVWTQLEVMALAPRIGNR